MGKKLLFILLFVFGSGVASAQYFVSETDPITYKWRQIDRKDAGKIIYPDFLEDRASVVAKIADTIRPYITYGLYDLMYKFPITLHPSTVLSNGLVTWTPKRMELMTALPVNTFAVPWLTQLTIHESRHVVQLSSLNQGFTKGASYLLGEQAPGIVAIVMPTYFYEGDAVAAETQMTMYGRGLQPEFTIAYRAMMNEDTKKINVAKMKLGSFKEQMPSSYEFGYQVTQFGREYYGPDFWERILNYVGRRSYTIFSYYFALNKYIGSGSKPLILESFADLKQFWHEASQEENTTTILPHDTKYYTTYSNPLEITPSLVLALKESMQEPTKFVVVNSDSGGERNFQYIGYITSRPEKRGKRVLWTEYKPSLSWGNKNSSEIRYMDIKTSARKPYSSRPKSVKNLKGDMYYVTALGDEGYAMINFDKENKSYLMITDTLFHAKHRIPMPDPYTSFNGLAWDDKTNTLAAIILDKEGMYLASLSKDDGRITKLTEPSYVTRSNLRAKGGKLYFNSIASGKDEAHSFDLESGEELQLTTSKYGSTSPTPMSDSTILLSTYTRLGYRLARQELDSAVTNEVVQSQLPVNRVNYPFRSWGLPKIDTMNIGMPTSLEGVKSEKYSKAAHLFKVHSWLPLYLNIQKLMDERQLTIGAGATVMSQNMLNTMVAGVAGGYVGREGGAIGSMYFSYRGLPVLIDVNFDYGGGKQLRDYSVPLDFAVEDKDYLGAGVSLALPLNLSSGNKNRFFTTSVGYTYHNGLYMVPDGRDIQTGVHKIGTGIYFENTLRKATNDLSPRLGYFLSLHTAFNPKHSNFGQLCSVSGGVYLPGFLPNNSITIKLGYQYQKPEENKFYQAILFPRGVKAKGPMEYQGALGVSYKAPLFYPDFALAWNYLYIKRFWVDLFGEMAHYNLIGSKNREAAFTYGLTLHMDFNIFEISNNVDMALSLFKPSDNKKPMFTIGFGVAF